MVSNGATQAASKESSGSRLCRSSCGRLRRCQGLLENLRLRRAEAEPQIFKALRKARAFPQGEQQTATHYPKTNSKNGQRLLDAARFLYYLGKVTLLDR